jgi:hypothetical protein
MLPAVSRMVEILDSTENPYKHALRALLCLLRRQHEASTEHTAAVEA